MPGKIKVAIVGVGNCASSLVQGIRYYQQSNSAQGLITEDIGGWRPGDIEVVAAFDVDDEKVGRDLSDAIWAGHNCTLSICEVPETGVIVQRGPTLDGLGKYMSEAIDQSAAPPVNVAEVLRDSGAQILINYLPVGSELAARHYAQAAIDAGCGMVNCMPVFLASTPEWADKFRAAGLPIVGDDIKSQVGATIVHRVLAELMYDRGVTLDRTYQLNFGGNTDFLNMLERERLKSKKISKTQAVTSVMGVTLPAESVHIGPSDHVPWLEDRKWAHIRLEGRGWGGAPLSIDLKLEVHDSPNSAAVVCDAVRWAALAAREGHGGPLIVPSAYYMKSPPEQGHDAELRRELNDMLA